MKKSHRQIEREFSPQWGFATPSNEIELKAGFSYTPQEIKLENFPPLIYITNRDADSKDINFIWNKAIEAPTLLFFNEEVAKLALWAKFDDRKGDLVFCKSI